MGSSSSKVAKRVAQSQARAISPRERIEKLPTMSSNIQTLRHNRDSLDENADHTEADKFRTEYFPSAHWEQYPVEGNIEEMAKSKPAHAEIRSEPDPEIPPLAEEKDNQDLIHDLTFIGKGLMPGPDKASQFPRLRRDESKMPKARISLPEKKLKGFLDANQFAEIYEVSKSFSVEELSLKYETQQKLLEDIFRTTEWCTQPMGSTLVDNAQRQREEMMQEREAINRANAERLHKPNQGGTTPYERGYGTGVTTS